MTEGEHQPLLRDVFGVRGAFLGGPVLLLRALWLLPFAFLITVPFLTLSWFVSCRLGVCANPNYLSGLLVPVTDSPDQWSLWEEVGTRCLRAAMAAPPLVLVSTVTIVVLAQMCAGQAVHAITLWRVVRRAWSALVVLGVVIMVVPTVVIVVPLLLIPQRRVVLALEGQLPSQDQTVLLLLLLLICVGSVAGLLAGILGHVAVAPVVIEGDTAFRGIGRVIRLALRRVLPTAGTAFIAITLASVTGSFFAQVLTVGPTNDVRPEWLFTALHQTLSGAVAVPLVSAMYFVRYLDLRLRQDRFDQEALANALR